jgi:hypothetical protein
MGWAAHLEAADRAAMEHLGGETVTYTPGSGPAVPVTGIFDEAYVLADASDARVSSSGPAIFFRLADLPSDPETDAGVVEVTVGAKTYRRREVKKDGQGGVLLLLHET